MPRMVIGRSGRLRFCAAPALPLPGPARLCRPSIDVPGAPRFDARATSAQGNLSAAELSYNAVRLNSAKWSCLSKCMAALLFQKLLFGVYLVWNKENS